MVSPVLVQTLTLVWSLEQVISCCLHGTGARVSSEHVEVEHLDTYVEDMIWSCVLVWASVCIESVTSGALPVTLL